MEKFTKIENGQLKMRARNPISSLSILNNQPTEQDITGLVFNPASVKAFKFSYVITRQTDDNYRREFGFVTSYYDEELLEWIDPSGEYMGHASGVNFFIDSSGQLSYTSTNLSGANYSGSIEYTIEIQL